MSWTPLPPAPIARHDAGPRADDCVFHGGAYTRLATDQPWEGPTSGYFSVIQDGRKVRLYYRGSATVSDHSVEQFTCVAESDDGIHFTRPRVGLIDFQDALAGSPAYDLISLVEDARRDVAPDVQAACLDRYIGGAGIAWMFGEQALGAGAQPGALLGALVALGVPIAGAGNWVLLQYLHERHAADPAIAEPDMLPAVLLGAAMSAALTLPLALPLRATAHDIGLLALLGVVQLAIPCMLVIRVAKVLSAPEVSLLGLLEVIFGVLWAWWGAGEAPGPQALAGGALVVAALVANELAGLLSRRARLGAAHG